MERVGVGVGVRAAGGTWIVAGRNRVRDCAQPFSLVQVQTLTKLQSSKNARRNPGSIRCHTPYRRPETHTPNQMSTSVKKMIQKNKSPADLTELCTKQLWKQSIEAGKAEQLVGLLWQSSEGQRALKLFMPIPVECFLINRYSSDGASSFYMRRCKETEAVFLLINDSPHAKNPKVPQHALGGYYISWNSSDDVTDWAFECVHNMELDESKIFFKKALGVKIPKRDSDGDEVESAIEWLQSEGEDWLQDLEYKLSALFTEAELPTDGKENPSVITPEEMEDYISSHTSMAVRAVFAFHVETF